MNHNKALSIPVGILGLVFWVLVFGAVCNRSDRPPLSAEQKAAAEAQRSAARARSEKEQRGIDACQTAIEVVKQRLKAPSTAEFPGCIWKAHLYEIRATPDEKTWWVIGHADSQNSFGAMIRTQYVVTLTRQNGRWTKAKVAMQ